MTSDAAEPATTAFVWIWLPGALTPVVAGRLQDHGSIVTFTYGRTYLERADAMPLYLPELPLRAGEITPISGVVAGCIADAGPDAWGRRLIEHGRRSAAVDPSPLDYLLAPGSDRIGALDVQSSAARHVERAGDPASLAELAEAADRIERGIPLSAALDRALLHGSSVGGARPKALLTDGGRRTIAKFSSSSDAFPVVQAEFVAMELARRAGLAVAPVALAEALGRQALVVERFDRPADGSRRLVVSAMTILELHDADGMAGRYATYTALADVVRSRFTDPDATLRELFSRVTFNVLTGNTDDHARNHAAFWDGSMLSLTPAYDVCPQRRTGGEAAQAMAFGPDGARLSQVARCVQAAATYHLDRAAAAAIVEQQIEVVRHEWTDTCDHARLTTAERDALWGRQFLNPYALEGW